ncbi:ParB N-terminal domain-containing protein [Pseudomonas sp. B21-028]|uniref:ParB/RepB/Spo0J family partition protein n=1 Tax=Pseudomonas TaxID=286 RepID=UPI0005BBF099|nr:MULTISPECIES: plasmid partitioning protein RepB C-terminal domain-containing protein [Pseudomonas]KIR18285.1 RepB plasmid partitioning protein [Pseudomonas fluorescens]MDD2030870.1 ParB N-terminal domain-containing protein [Pseudomonas sp. 39167]OAB49330.1 chromosome partitioning protein [Pseudomonas thivervalensis]UVL86224.1 ParB N-terminal domain-containing protein [Pseudomonas sp. B21-028]SDF76957.1 ParB-like nuclease domain-containing protein [Pseudomonas thivervalensis]
MTEVKQAFEHRVIAVPLDRILPSRRVDQLIPGSKKYASILSSIRELGVVEPLVVHPKPLIAGGVASYLLLDGHFRLEALKALGAIEALCLISTDDEAFTYNRQINRLTPIQEHKMILSALKKGIGASRIAAVLGINVDQVHDRENLLKGIAPEVAEMLKVRMVSQDVFRSLRQMKPIRQIETVEMMISANCFTRNYARMVLAASRPEMLIETRKKPSEVSAVDIARMEREMENLQHDYKQVEDTLGETMLVLVVTKGYLVRLLRNEAIAGYVTRYYSELLEELMSIMEAVTSDARQLERE